MKRDEAVGALLKGIESEHRKQIRWTATTLQSASVGDVQIVLYSPVDDSTEIQVFTLANGLTPTIQKAITQWFESFLAKWGAPLSVNR